MNIKRIKKTILTLTVLILLSGCTATYNLDISPEGFKESLSIYSNQIDVTEYYVLAYNDENNPDVFDADVSYKIDGLEYYETKIFNDRINFNYKFNKNNFSRSNIANMFFSSFVFKEHDQNDDGEKDYYIISTSSDFDAFDEYKDLSEITINIKIDYEVISNNADEVNKNVYTWHFTKDNIKSINMVFNPEKIIDYRNLWEKLLDGEYTNIFTISLLLAIIGFIIYIILRRKSQKVDEL